MKILEEKPESLDDLVVRARQDPVLKKLIKGTSGRIGLNLIWQFGLDGDVKTLSWTGDEKHIIATDEGKVEVIDRTTNDLKTVIPMNDVSCAIVTGFKKDSKTRLFYAKGNKIYNAWDQGGYKFVGNTRGWHWKMPSTVKSITADSHSLVVCTGSSVFLYEPKFAGSLVQTDDPKHKFAISRPRKVDCNSEDWAILREEGSIAFFAKYNRNYSHTRNLKDKEPLIDFSLSNDYVAYLAKDELTLAYKAGKSSVFEMPNGNAVAISPWGNMIAVGIGKYIKVYNIENE